MTARRTRDVPAGLACLGTGALVAASLPPWGWWPLAFVGIAVFVRLLDAVDGRSRFARGWIFSVGWLAPGMGWMWYLTAPGYVVAVAMFGCLHGLACLVAPRGRWSWVGLPAALTVAEAIRFCFPFGGVPLASLAISQVAGPLRGLAALGGALLLSWAALQVAAVIAHPSWRRWALVGLLLAASYGATRPGGSVGRMVSVAFVQGGGPQGTRAIHTNPRDVVERHLAATRLLVPGPDLVVWPENVIDVERFADSVEHDEVAAEARRLDAPILVGVTEEAVGRGGFLNAQVVVLPDGRITGRYEKVRRVPFGEYMPMRGLLQALGAPVDLVPRNAVAGSGPAYLDTPVGRVAVAISWEVFFGGRARDGVSHGGQLLINPTNGSSYTGTVLQTQQVASSRLRAIETDRWVVQVAPTGFSAFVSPSGAVADRTAVGEQRVAVHRVEMRTTRTPYSRIGDVPFATLAVGILVLAIAGSRGERSATRPPAEAAIRAR